MKVRLERDRLVIEAESQADIAYLEDTMKIRQAGDAVRLVRVNRTTVKQQFPFELRALPVGCENNG